MDVAIVGIGCRLPGGADDPHRFWELLAGGVDAVGEVPPERFDAAALYDPDPAAPGKLTSRWGGFVEPIEEFDAAFFGISPREARRIDPQQRLLLEVGWEALEDGGQPPDRVAGTDTGVFVGVSTHDYGDMQRSTARSADIDAWVGTGSASSVAANRLSYVFDFHGPSLVIDTACSSSLTAVHLACDSLERGDCELALAGGVNAILLPEPTIMFSKASMLSPDGRCKPFDERADGYVRSEGAAVVVLKPLQRALEDRDPVYAVVRATAVNQDGRTSGITVPGVPAQRELFLRALRRSGLAPAEVHYVEAHGTGTPVGDPLEAQALGEVYGRGRPADRPCLLGSVKSNLGHLEAAAGVAGLVKAALALHHRWVPPSLHFSRGNPSIPFDEHRLRVVTQGQPWPAPPGQGLAAVNAFGFGGANAHAVLAEAPVAEPLPPDERGVHVLGLSARSEPALRALAGAWVEALADPAPLRDLCHTAAARRTHHDHRLAAVAASGQELRERLGGFLAGEPVPGVVAGRAAGQAGPEVVFVFSGMGPQWAGMGRRLLHEEAVFRETIEACEEALAPLAGWSLLEALEGGDGEETPFEGDRAQVANLAVQVGLAALWRSWGLEPDAVVGHSSGESSAACVAGALSLEDAVRLAFHRGRLLHTLSGTGGMLAAGIPPDTAQALADAHAGKVCVAAVNGPESVTLSGDVVALAGIAEDLRADGLWCRELGVRIPYHSPGLDPLEGELRDCIADVAGKPSGVPLLSTTTGEWLDGDRLDAGHWWRNMRRPVAFSQAVARLVAGGFATFVEVSAHPVLVQSVQECVAATGGTGTVLPTLRRGDDDRRSMLRAVAALFAAGRRFDWTRVAGSEGACVRLPTYPWQRERYWIGGPSGDGRAAGGAGTPRPAAAVGSGGDAGEPLAGRRLAVATPTWEVDLADARLAYLDGHVVGGAAAMPGAAYTIMALACAAAAGDGYPAALDEVAFHGLMRLDERDGRVLQGTVDPSGTVAIHSGPKGGAGGWTARASARLSTSRHAHAEPVALEALRARCTTTLPDDAFYRLVEAEFGLSYDGAFRALTGILQGRDEALARIAPADAAQPGGRPPVAVLDAAFQSLLAAVALDAGEGAGGAGMLPVGAAHVECRAPLRDCAWVHATVRRDGGAVTEGSVRLLDAAGTVVAACDGIRLQALGGERHDAGDLLREEVWEPVPAVSGGASAGVPEPADLEMVAADAGFTDYYSSVEPALDALAVHLVRQALDELGWDGRPDAGADPDAGDALALRLGVAARHRRYLARLLELAAPGAAPRDASALEQPRDAAGVLDGRADVRPGVELVRETGRRLVATLRGEDDPRRWMIVGEKAQALADFYAATPSGRFYNHVLADAVAARAPDRPLRVLEVGAGTGATTQALLARLGDRVGEYLCTDVSPFFVKQARARFADHAAVRCEVLDVERPPGELEHSFDVVVAADVVHAAARVGDALGNLRRLLAPGGLLVLLEPVRRSSWLELIFGQVEGWWGFTDHALRPDHPLLAPHQWRRVLSDAGYADVQAVADEPPDGGDPMQVVLLARSPGTAEAAGAEAAAPPRRWLVLADRAGVGDGVAAALRARGDRCTIVRHGTAYRRHGADEFALHPASEDQWARLLQESAAGGPVPGLLHLWGLDAPPGEEATAATLMAFQERACGGVVHLMRALHAGKSSLGDVWLVTSGAQPVGPAQAPLRMAATPLWGLGRVLRNEHRGWRCRLVDLDPDATGSRIDALLAELDAAALPGGDEPEVAFRGERRYARRLRAPALGRPAATSRRRLSPDEAAVRVEVATPGDLQSVGLRAGDLDEPGPEEVAIRVRAASLNFRDVLVGTGLLRTDEAGRRLGLDCAGVVTATGSPHGPQPGDEVVAIARGSLASRVVARADLVAPKPPGLSFAVAAGLPAAFVTAYASLHDMAGLAPGERVLVHSASGGVGLAAVQLCRRAGAEVFATAGSPDKRAFLASLGVEHVMDSRSLAFADEVLEATGGEGVDVVLNALVGEARVRGLALLRRSGRFVDLAVRDLQEDAPLGLRPFAKGLSYHAFGDAGEPFPASWGRALRLIARDVADGALEPLPHTAFDLQDAASAFRLLAQARHIGKVVVTADEPHYWALQRPAPLFDPEATYLVAGGLGGFALAVARWMVRGGARHLVLTSRSGAPHPEDAAALEALRASPASVRILRADAADRTAMAAVLDEVRATMPPLKGVLHAAMTLDDDLLGRLDYDRFRAVLAPKVAGAWILHELTRDDDLDVFLLFSSASSVIGMPTQGSYAAANAFLDALAAHRRALGLPALTVNWGALAGSGYVARRPQLQEVSARVGVRIVPPQAALAGLERALRDGVTRVAIGRVDWERWSGRGPGLAATGEPGNGNATGAAPAARPTSPAPLDGTADARTLEEHLVRRVAMVLEDAPERIDPERPLSDLGLDSLMAVELQTVLRRDLDVDVPLVDILDGASIRRLAGGLGDRARSPGT